MHWCKEPGNILNNRSRMFEATYEPSLVSECCRYPSRRNLPHVKVRKLLNWSLHNLIYRSIDAIAHTSASREAEPNIRTKHSQLSNNAHWGNGPREERNTLKWNFRVVLALKWYIPPWMRWNKVGNVHSAQCTVREGLKKTHGFYPHFVNKGGGSDPLWKISISKPLFLFDGFP